LVKVFSVSVDYLIREEKFSSHDQDVLKRIDDIEQLDSRTNTHLFIMIDQVIQNFKTKKAFAR
jgi:hypothetical protein